MRVTTGSKEATMKTIVLGYDGTEPAERALARAAELARAFGARVVVTSVAPLLVGAAAARGLSGFDPADPPDAHREQLAHAATILREQGVATEVELGAGDAANEILELADARDADLIVVGARERSLLARLFEPSVSASVERRAHRDVLVVH
jgi:nucleotide-binding universal stress UspA family protein